jgi:hypothetical protein
MTVETVEKLIAALGAADISERIWGIYALHRVPSAFTTVPNPLRMITSSMLCSWKALERVVNNLKDESEPYRKMTVETVEKLIAALGAAENSTDNLGDICLASCAKRIHHRAESIKNDNVFDALFLDAR